MVWGRGATPFFCMWICSCLSTIFWIKYSFTFEWTWCPFRKLIDHSCVCLLLNSQSYYIGLYVSLNASNTLFLLPKLCTEFQNWEYTNFFKLLWFSRGLLPFHINLKISFSISTKKKSHWNFEKYCTESRFLWIVLTS